MRHYPGTIRPMPANAIPTGDEGGNMGAEIAQAFPLEQSAHISALLGRLLAQQNLIDMLWTNELAKADDPVAEARELKTKVMSLIVADPEDSVQVEAQDELERRLDSIIRRTMSLAPEPGGQPPQIPPDRRRGRELGAHDWRKGT